MEVFKMPEQLQKEYCIANNIPEFAPHNGVCSGCNLYIYVDERVKAVAATQLVTGCPFCHKSFVD